MNIIRKQLNLIPVICPIIGHRYHVSWSQNPHMTWILMNINGDGTCELQSKDNQFQTQLTSLRAKNTAPRGIRRRAKQLEIAFENKLHLT